LRSLPQVYEAFLEAFTTLGGVPHYIAYDDACHFGPLVLNPKRASAKNATCLQRLLARETQPVVDPFHMRGHVDAKCKQYYDPANYPELKKVNMEVRAHKWERSARCASGSGRCAA
jgi:hypothetical protein